jgi:uncharacterized protein (DUF736 family)
LRAIGARKAAAYAAQRAGGEADVVVIGHAHGHRDGLTEDYLSVDLPDPAPARGDRFRAVLSPSPSQRGLVALPIA